MKQIDKPRVRTAMFLIVFGVFVYTLFQNPGRYTNALGALWKVLSTLAWGFSLGYILNLIMKPIEKGINLLQRKLKHKLGKGAVRTISSLLALIIAIGVVALVLVMIVPSVISIVEKLISVLPGVTDSVSAWLTEYLPKIPPGADENADLSARISTLLSQNTKTIVDYLSSLVSSYSSIALEITAGVFSGIINLVLVLAISMYVVTGKEKVCGAARSLMEAYIPEKQRKISFDVVALADEKFSLFFRGQVVEAVILGVLCFIGMLIFRFPSPGLISVLMATTAIVPVAGPWIGSFTSILLILIINPLQGLLFALYILILQQIEDNVIYPRVVGKSIGIPGIVVLCAVVLGVKIAGMLGIIVGVPLCAVLFELITKYTRARLERRTAPNANAD